MRRFRAQSLCALLLLAGACVCATQLPPKIDKQRVEAYLRYAEAIEPKVKIEIEDPTPSQLPGYYHLNAHLLLGTQKEDRKYFISQDGQEIINGTFWSLNESPFTDTLKKLTLDGPAFGVPDARVTIVVFSDFECPYCRDLAQTLRTNIPQKFPNDVRVVEKNFPIEAIHPWSRAAAEAGVCMASQSTGAFWAYHDWMFEHQTAVDSQFKDKKADFAAYLRDTTAAIAQQQNVDPAKVKSCIESHASAARVAKDMEEGKKLNVQATPAFYVNGRAIGGAIPWPSIDTLIQLELNRPKDLALPVVKAAP